MTFEKFLHIRNKRYHSIGCTHIEHKLNYAEFIDKFAEFHPIVCTLEDMQKQKGFPHSNKTKRDEMPQKYRDMVTNLH